MTQDEYAEMLSQAKEQFKQGTPLFGKDGAFHRVLGDFLNSALEGEMDSHLYNTKTSTKSNRRNGKKWDNLSHYFDYTEPIRRIMYTTNIVEGYHCQIRKVTKTKGVSQLTKLSSSSYILTIETSKRSGLNHCETGVRQPNSSL